MADNVFVSEEKVNSDILNKKNVYILSTDVDSKNIFFLLLQYCVRVSGFVVREKGRINSLYSLPILTYDGVREEEAVYVTEKGKCNEYCDVIDENRIYCVELDKFVRNEFRFDENGIKKCNAALMIIMILSRVQKKRAVFLIKSQDYYFWTNLLSVLGREVKNPMMISVDQDIDQIFDLMYSDIEDQIIFIALFEHDSISKMLVELGLKQTQHFVHIGNSFSGNVTKDYFGFDWFLGNTFIGKEKKGKEEQTCYGFYTHGNLENCQKRIVLLGNSATDPFFYPQKSWPEMFWEECNRQQVNVVIYNGAVTDYSSSNEVIKLFRDVLLLKPDIVVSYSGIIDFREYVPEYPYINLNLMRTSHKWESENKKEVIFGIRDYRPAYERWLNNEKIMKQICEINGITFFGVLQPWIGSDDGDGSEKLQIWSDYYWQVAFPQFAQYIENAKEFKKRIQADIKENEWLYDFTNIFSEIDDADIYYDSIHVNEAGNLMVAKMFSKILKLFE